MARVQRREAEAHAVRPAEVGHDVRALDQRAADAPRLGMAQRDVRAALLRGARGVPSSKPSARAPRRGCRPRAPSASPPWRGSLDPGLADQLGADVDRGEAEDRRRAGEEAAHAGVGLVGALHRELVALPEPALDRRAQRLLQRAPRRTGRPGPRARRSGTCRCSRRRGRRRDASSSTGTAPAEWLRSHRTSAPPACAASVIARQVGERARAVGDVRERDERDVAGAAGRRDLLRLRPVDAVALEQAQLGPPAAASPSST